MATTVRDVEGQATVLVAPESLGPPVLGGSICCVRRPGRSPGPSLSLAGREKGLAVRRLIAREANSARSASRAHLHDYACSPRRSRSARTCSNRSER